MRTKTVKCGDIPTILFWTFLIFTPLFAQSKPEQTEFFIDAAAASDLNFTHFNGMTGKLYLPEIMGAGAAIFDYDNDGDTDVFLVQGKVLEPNVKPEKAVFPWTNAAPPVSRLFRNDLTINADGSRSLKFTDVTKQSGITADGYGFGAATGDFNNDGFTDLYVCNLENNKLFLNKGDGTFADVTKSSRTDDSRWSAGASFLDYDRDGWLDLIVVNYADFQVTGEQSKCYAPTTAADYCGPKSFRAVGKSLFRNKGDGTFEDATAASGIGGEFGHGLGIVTADFNDDGWLDVYVANDGDPNELWINQKNGKFVNEGFFSGAAVNRLGRAEASMGVDAGDFNGDGTEDVFVTHLLEETHTLYANTGGAMFEDVTAASGVALPEQRLTGFGTAFFDYDNDGLLDIFIANGAVQLVKIIKRPGNQTTDQRFPLGQLNQLFRNKGDGTYEDVSGAAGNVFTLSEVSRGAAFGDLDNDGDMDVLVANNSGKARLLVNQIGNKNYWAGFRLIGADGKRDALGAKIEVFIAGKNVVRRRARTDGSYSSAHDPRITVGLGKSVKIEKVRVTWTNGKTEEWRNPAVGKYMVLRAGSGENQK